MRHSSSAKGTYAALAILGAAGLLRGQAAPGPIVANPPVSSAPVSAAKAVPSPAVARNSIVGEWQLQQDSYGAGQIGNPQAPRRRNGGTNGPYGGNGPYGRRPRVYPGGRGNRPYGRNRAGAGGGPPEPGLLRPPNRLKIDQKDYQVFMSDDQGHEIVFFTDGRNISRSDDPKHQQAAAHWDGTRLVTEEKDDQGRKFSRTFELSGDGLHLEETIEFEGNGRLGLARTLHYRYDIAGEAKP